MEDKQDTQKVFDSIASHFDKTRKYPWKEVEEFIKDLEGRILDLGCGNGRHCSVAVDLGLDIIGLDASFELLKIAKQRCPKGGYIKGDARDLPFKVSSFNGILYIAAIHHLKEGRVKSLKECKRILKPGGKIMVSSWSRESDRWDLPEEQRDVMVPWNRDDGEVFDRYYHLYTLEELKEDVVRSGLTIADHFISGQNNYISAVNEG